MLASIALTITVSYCTKISSARCVGTGQAVGGEEGTN